MNESVLPGQSITELAQGLRNKEFSAVELTEWCLSQIEALDSRLNAFRLLCGEKALAEAQDADAAIQAGSELGALHGIPFAVKDLFDVKGLPTSAGSRLLECNNICVHFE